MTLSVSETCSGAKALCNAATLGFNAAARLVNEVRTSRGASPVAASMAMSAFSQPWGCAIGAMKKIRKLPLADCLQTKTAAFDDDGTCFAPNNLSAPVAEQKERCSRKAASSVKSGGLGIYPCGLRCATFCAFVEIAVATSRIKTEGHGQ